MKQFQRVQEFLKLKIIGWWIPWKYVLSQNQESNPSFLWGWGDWNFGVEVCFWLPAERIMVAFPKRFQKGKTNIVSVYVHREAAIRWGEEGPYWGSAMRVYVWGIPTSATSDSLEGIWLGFSLCLIGLWGCLAALIQSIWTIDPLHPASMIHDPSILLVIRFIEDRSAFWSDYGLRGLRGLAWWCLKGTASCLGWHLFGVGTGMGVTWDREETMDRTSNEGTALRKSYMLAYPSYRSQALPTTMTSPCWYSGATWMMP